MTFRLRILPRAEHDAQHIFDWLKARSPDGAARWWFAFDEAVHKLIDDPHGYGLAPETESDRDELRQFLFKTRRGRRYRGVFVVIGDEVRVLRIRGPGEAPLEPDELERTHQLGLGRRATAEGRRGFQPIRLGGLIAPNNLVAERRLNHRHTIVRQIDACRRLHTSPRRTIRTSSLR